MLKVPWLKSRSESLHDRSADSSAKPVVEHRQQALLPNFVATM
jgi:hypothetical protein